MPPIIKKSENVWKRLTRLFRSGPVIRHKIASSERMYEPVGTARAYKKELSSLYVNSLASYGQYERLARYADYSEMEYTPEIASALDIYADEITALDEKGRMIEIESENDEIKGVLETLFFDILNIEFNLWSWVRNLTKYGDFALFVDASEDNGILNLLPIPINEIEREEGYDQNDPFAVRFRWLTQGNMILENWQIIHFRLLGNDNFLPYGSSIIEPARRIWRQLILIEDAMLVYRIVRSPERRVFHIEVGNIKPEDIEGEMNRVMDRLRRNKVVDSTTGRVDLRYNPLSVDEDYFLPLRNGHGSKIETLPGGQFTGDIEDVEYIQNKLFSALKIPKSYLGYEGDVGSKATLAQEDVRFSRTIQRIQKILLSEMTKIAVVHLFLLGYEGDDLIDYEIKMSNPSTIAEQQKLELWRTRFEIAGTAQEGTLDRTSVRKWIFALNDDQIAEIEDGIKYDKMFDMELEATQAPGDEEVVPGDTAGEDELPTTLGGGEEEGGEELAAGLVHRTHDDELSGPELLHDISEEEESVEEKRNPGSTGDSAEISVSKGKDLFDPAEDLHTVVFGTEKQTASDPFDQKALHRVVTRPFSEDVDKDDGSDVYVKENQEVAQKRESRLTKVDQALREIRSIKARKA